MIKPFKKDTIEEKLKRINNNSTKEIMKKNKNENEQSENALNSRVSSKGAIKTKSENQDKYLVIGSDGNHEIKDITNFNEKIASIIHLKNDKMLMKKLLGQAKNVLNKLSNWNPIFTPDRLINQIIEDLLTETLSWNIKKYPSAFNQVSYWIMFQIRESFKKEAKHYHTKYLDDVSQKNIFDSNYYSSFCGDFDVNGNYRTFPNRYEFNKYNRLLAIDNWLIKYGRTLDREIIKLFKMDYSREEIALIFNIKETVIYNLFRRMIYYFKKHPIR